jgi:DNA-binding MarR family transcriptional regulator
LEGSFQTAFWIPATRNGMAQMRRDSCEKLASDIRQTAGALVHRLRTKSAGQTVSMSQGEALRRLYDTGPLTVADLARLELVTPQAMGVTIASLEEEGLVARTIDPDDARRWNAMLTDAGRKTLVEGRAARQAWLSNALRERLSESERRRLAEAVLLLRKVMGE